MKKNKLTIEELMEKLKEKKQRTKIITIFSFLRILEDEETFVLYENGPHSTQKYNGTIIVRLKDGYQMFSYYKEKAHVKDKNGKDQIVYPNCIDVENIKDINKNHIKGLENFEKQLEARKEILDKRNEKYKKIRQDHRVKHLFDHN